MDQTELIEDLENIIEYLEGKLIDTAIRNLQSLINDLKQFGVD